MQIWQTYLETHRETYIDELKDFLSIPSISSLPENAPDVQRAAEWVAARMRNAGIEHVEILPTGGHPVVYGDWLHAREAGCEHASGQQCVLIYGHFDTQPVDPLELWTTPPFDPHIRDGRIYARGASDNKGNMLIPILAVEAMLQTEGRLPVNVKFFFEGQEEIGSPQLPGLIAREKTRLACDMIISADAGQWSEDQPALLVGFKGLCGLQIDVNASCTDLHSGMVGGTLQNPLLALAHILASMRSPDGRILVEGFYDDVLPLSDEERRQMACLPYDDAAYKQSIGLPQELELVGEPGYTTLERAGARPTLDPNGIWGGFEGAGVKTVIPSLAHAKITCRLVANQDPLRILELIERHVEQHTPPGVSVKTTRFEGHVRAYHMEADHPGNIAARRVLETLYGKPPFYVRMGGTLPVSTLFLDLLNAYTVSLSFSLTDESYHAPDEFFRLSSFERGPKAYCMMLEELKK
jgi:acetylornithine deacetylase/succinyl-diaminopimelate desuccinylase-like protein